jgi:DNA-binding transcriptional regulator YiaG
MTALALIRLRRMLESGAARAIREASGLSLSEMGSEAKVDRTTIHRWETRRRRPRATPAAARYLRVLEEIASG